MGYNKVINRTPQSVVITALCKSNMYEKLSQARKNVNEMPRLLKFIFLVLFTPAAGLLLFGFWPWPGAQYSMQGVNLTYKEFWSSGMAFIFISLLIVQLAVCFGMAFKKGWIRWVLLTPWVFLVATSLNKPLVSIAILVSISFGLALYLFKRQSVNAYFNPSSR